MTVTIDRRGASVTRGDTPPAPIGRQRSVEALLKETNRAIVPIRNGFVQGGHGRTTRPGPLCTFLRSHDDRGLEAYLFSHAMASASEPYNCVLPSGVWVRVLGLTDDATMTSARGAVSKIMKRLEDRNLIARTRTSRRANINLLREDGTKEAYQRPFGKSREERWFQLPHAYWTEEHYKTLSLPAKTMLIIALTQKDRFQMPEERGPAWYGVSPDSVGDGLRELHSRGLIERELIWEEEARADSGWTKRHLYTLLGSFSKEERRKASNIRSGGVDAQVLDLDDLKEMS